MLLHDGEKNLTICLFLLCKVLHILRSRMPCEQSGAQGMGTHKTCAAVSAIGQQARSAFTALLVEPIFPSGSKVTQ